MKETAASYNNCGKTDGNDDDGDEKGKALSCNKFSFFFSTIHGNFIHPCLF